MTIFIVLYNEDIWSAVIACCVADATPIGIIAETPDALNFESDTWLEVEGVL